MEDRHALVPAPGPLLGRSWAAPAPGPLLGRSRSWAALLSINLLSLFVLSLPCAIQAQGYPGGGSGGGYPGGGSYSGPIYSSPGNCTLTTPGDPQSPHVYPYALTSSGFGGGNAYSGPSNGTTSVCTGKITATFTWQPADAGQTPPQNVIVYESGSASYGGTILPKPSGTCADGLGDALVPNTSGATSSGTHYTVMAGAATITRTVTPSANVNCNGGYSGASVSYTASALLPPPLQAHSTVDTANWDAIHPRFFSGTNCSVSGTATAYSAPPGTASYPNGGSYVTQATLSIGGTPVKYYYDTAFSGPYQPGAILGTNQVSVPLSVVFDSTHFADASTIPAKMTVTDSGGLTYTVNLSGPACNKLLAVANITHSWNDAQTGQNVALNATNGPATSQSSGPSYQPCPGVVLQSKSGNIGTGSSPITNHHRSDFINDIATRDQTMFFAATHADPGYLGDCYSVSGSDPAYDPGAYLNDADITRAISIRTTALSAPYLFVFLHGCDSGGDVGLANDFGVTSSNDTGFVGFGAAVSVSQHNTNFTVQAWQFLMQGQKLLDALNNSVALYPVQAYKDANTAPQNSGTTIPVLRGDNNMTLYGKVYNWVSGPTWYR